MWKKIEFFVEIVLFTVPSVFEIYNMTWLDFDESDVKHYEISMNKIYKNDIKIK